MDENADPQGRTRSAVDDRLMSAVEEHAPGG
jgi:hypothetical protein